MLIKFIELKMYKLFWSLNLQNVKFLYLGIENLK